MQRLLIGLNGALLLALALGCQGPVQDGSKNVVKAGIEVFFSDPLAPFQDNRLSNRLLDFINQAQGTLDIAIHDLGETKVLDALLLACARGVEIRMLVDQLVPQSRLRSFADKDCFRSHRVVPSRKQHGLMHHKFAVRDHQWVWTGSANWTQTGLFLNANDGLLVQQVELANKFQRQFDWLFSGGYLHEYRVPADPGPIQAGSANIFLYFSPDPQIENEIIRRLNTARYSIQLAMFYLTNDRLYRALLDAMGRGVRVNALLSQRGAGPCDLSEMDELLDLGKGTIAPIQGVLHHKFAVIDGYRVITGSANWTKSAFQNNFENLLIVEDRHIAQRYLSYFDVLLQDASAYQNNERGPVRLIYRHFNTIPGTARIEWHPIGSPSVMGYEVCKSDTPTGNCTERFQLKDPTARFWVDRGSPPETTLYYRVTAMTQSRDGQRSTPLQVRITKRPLVLSAAQTLHLNLGKTPETWISVRFKVAHVRQTTRGNLLLLSDPLPRDAFRVFVPECALKGGFGDMNFNSLEGQTILVSGVLTSYLGPEIILYDHGQLE